jgi:hypothetical protein
MRKHMCGSVVVGLFLAMALLASTAVSSYGWAGGGLHGGGGSWGSHGGGHWQGGGHWHGGWHGGHWRGHHFGPRVFVGLGFAAPFWWYPYGYPYADPWAYPVYSPPVTVESSPQTYIQQDTQGQQYWYYCQSPEGYYPYVKECPGGWQQVQPQPPPPPR